MLKRLILFVFVATITSTVIISCKTSSKTAAVACNEPEVSFKQHIAPLMIKYCIKCHGPKNNKEAFAEYASIKKLVDNGEMKHEVIKTKRMPKNAAMLAEEIKAIECWMNQGSKNN